MARRIDKKTGKEFKEPTPLLKKGWMLTNEHIARVEGIDNYAFIRAYCLSSHVKPSRVTHDDYKTPPELRQITPKSCNLFATSSTYLAEDIPCLTIDLNRKRLKKLNEIVPGLKFGNRKSLEKMLSESEDKVKELLRHLILQSSVLTPVQCNRLFEFRDDILSGRPPKKASIGALLLALNYPKTVEKITEDSPEIEGHIKSAYDKAAPAMEEIGNMLLDISKGKRVEGLELEGVDKKGALQKILDWVEQKWKGKTDFNPEELYRLGRRNLEISTLAKYTQELRGGRGVKEVQKELENEFSHPLSVFNIPEIIKGASISVIKEVLDRTYFPKIEKDVISDGFTHSAVTQIFSKKDQEYIKEDMIKTLEYLGERRRKKLFGKKSPEEIVDNILGRANERAESIIEKVDGYEKEIIGNKEEIKKVVEDMGRALEFSEDRGKAYIRKLISAGAPHDEAIELFGLQLLKKSFTAGLKQGGFPLVPFGRYLEPIKINKYEFNSFLADIEAGDRELSKEYLLSVSPILEEYLNKLRKAKLVGKPVVEEEVFKIPKTVNAIKREIEKLKKIEAPTFTQTLALARLENRLKEIVKKKTF
jgi:hypothetical protein